MVLCPQQTIWKTHQENCLSFFCFYSHHLITSEMCQPCSSEIEKMVSPGNNRVWVRAPGGVVQGLYPGWEPFPGIYMLHIFSYGAGIGCRASLTLGDWIRDGKMESDRVQYPREPQNMCPMMIRVGLFAIGWLDRHTRQNFLNFNIPPSKLRSYQNEDSDLRSAPGFCSFNKMSCDAGDTGLQATLGAAKHGLLTHVAKSYCTS